MREAAEIEALREEAAAGESGRPMSAEPERPGADWNPGRRRGEEEGNT